MIYTDAMGTEHGLPKYTVALAEAFDAACGDMAVQERADKRLVLMKRCLGTDYVCERCGGKTVQTVDVAELDALFAEVRAAYRSACREADVAEAVAQVQRLVPMIETLERAAALQGSAARSAFKRVR